MASKKRRKKASKTTRKVGKKRRKKASAISVSKSSLNQELGLLHKINKKVTRIDHTVNAGMHLAHKAKKAKRAADLDKAWAEREESGYE